jgi:GNAT superfamily N-acetyltransferase
MEQAGTDTFDSPYMQKMFNLAQFQGSIKPTGLLQTGQPFQSGIVDEKIGNSTVSYQLGDDGILKIFSLRTPQLKRGQGSATEAMNQIVQRADESGIPIKLDASPLDKKTSLNKLVNFYKKFGFEPTGETVNIIGEPVMMRVPKTLK